MLHLVSIIVILYVEGVLGVLVNIKCLFISFAVVKKKSSDVTNSSGKLKVVYDPSEHEFGLMPAPIHVGKYLREKRKDFQLPYDIWWCHEHNFFSSMKPASPKYKKIRNSEYYCQAYS